jgi:hypothetical protein
VGREADDQGRGAELQTSKLQTAKKTKGTMKPRDSRSKR